MNKFLRNGLHKGIMNVIIIISNISFCSSIYLKWSHAKQYCMASFLFMDILVHYDRRWDRCNLMAEGKRTETCNIDWSSSLGIVFCSVVKRISCHLVPRHCSHGNVKRCHYTTVWSNIHISKRLQFHRSCRTLVHVDEFINIYSVTLSNLLAILQWQVHSSCPSWNAYLVRLTMAPNQNM
jgi:hypothetical protein